MALLQWNCRGFRANRSDIDLLITRYSPAVICLQETLIHRSSYPIRGYVSYNLFADTDDLGRPHGGVSILVNSKCPQHEIKLQTPLKAVAAQITLHKAITVCSIYLSPRGNLSSQDLDDLIHQLPTPYLLLGDFNAHNILWGGESTDSRGKRIEDFLSKHQLCLWNDGCPTYIHPGSGSQTAIDLSVCHPSLLLDYSWSTHEDTCGSDHLPLILHPCVSSSTNHFPRWQLHKADWSLFREICRAEMSQLDLSVEDPMELFTSLLEDIALRTQ